MVVGTDQHGEFVVGEQGGHEVEEVVDAAGVVSSGLFRRRDFGFLGVLRTGCKDRKKQKRSGVAYLSVSKATSPEET